MTGTETHLTPYLSYSKYGFDSTTTEKPILVLLHGFLGNSKDWDAFIHHFNHHFRFIAFDLPGHGASLIPDTISLRFSEVVESIHAIVSRYTDTYRVLGYSFGGRIAFGLQHLAPLAITHLMIESSTPGIQKETERHRRIAFDNALAEKLMTLPFAQFLDEWFDYVVFHSQKRHPNFPTLLLNRQQNNTPQQLAKALRELGTGQQPSYWQTLSNITIPTLFITGEYDTKFRMIGQKLKKMIPNYTYIEVPKVSHNVHFENETVFHQHIQKWLSQAK